MCRLIEEENSESCSTKTSFRRRSRVCSRLLRVSSRYRYNWLVDPVRRSIRAAAESHTNRRPIRLKDLRILASFLGRRRCFLLIAIVPHQSQSPDPFVFFHRPIIQINSFSLSYTHETLTWVKSRK